MAESMSRCATIQKRTAPALSSCSTRQAKRSLSRVAWTIHAESPPITSGSLSQTGNASGASFLLMADSGSGTLHHIKIDDGRVEKIADCCGSGDGLAWDKFGRLFISDGKGGRLLVIPRPGDRPVSLDEGLTSAGGIALDA